MRAFEFVRADTADAAVRTVAAHPEAKFLGGGTNLVDLMKLGVERPDLLVDVTRLPFGSVDVEPNGTVRIGTNVRNSALAAHPAVRTGLPVLSQALLAGASGQLRNMATVGGNLLQRTRCVYFQDVTKPCNKREPGSGCPARQGVHRNLAILGASEDCLATHPSDLAVALAALDARVAITGPDGNRDIPLAQLHRLPGDHPEQDTTLRHGDLITSITVPPLAFAERSAYRKVRDRASYAFAVASVAAALDVDDGGVRDIRLAFGAVAHKPWRAHAAEEALRGQPATAASFRAAAETELAAAETLRDNGFKVPLIINIIVRTLGDLAGERS